MRGAVLLLAAAACSFDHGALSGDGGTGSDGRTDGSGDASRFTCYGTALVRVCLTRPTAPVQLTGADTSIDTDSTACAPLEAGGSTDACVLLGTTVAIDATGKLIAHGTRPLVIVASDTITVDGTIDVASHRGGAIGPNADPTACVAGTAPTYGNSGGGGYGGSHGTKGGNG